MNRTIYNPTKVVEQIDIQVEQPKKHSRIGIPNFEDRQLFAVIGLGVLAAAIPILVAIGLLAAAAWLITMKTLGIVHINDIHATIFGWLTDWEYYTDRVGATHRAATPNTLPLAWFVGWVNVYAIYQLCELIAWPIRSYRNMVKRHNDV
jgi:hypothetical protein